MLKKFESDGVVKDLKLEAAPEKLLPVSYPSGVSVEGIELTPTQVKDIPEVKLNGEEGHFYTLLFTGKFENLTRKAFCSNILYSIKILMLH